MFLYHRYLPYFTLNILYIFISYTYPVSFCTFKEYCLRSRAVSPWWSQIFVASTIVKLIMLPKKYTDRKGLGFMRIHKRLIVIIIIIYKRIRQSKRFVILIRRLFAVSRCSRCRAGIFATELVMRARDLVYHVACFTCASCGTPLNKGDHFGQRDGLVYCR